MTKTLEKGLAVLGNKERGFISEEEVTALQDWIWEEDIKIEDINEAYEAVNKMMVLGLMPAMDVIKLHDKLNGMYVAFHELNR